MAGTPTAWHAESSCTGNVASSLFRIGLCFAHPRDVFIRRVVAIGVRRGKGEMANRDRSQEGLRPAWDLSHVCREGIDRGADGSGTRGPRRI